MKARGGSVAVLLTVLVALAAVAGVSGMKKKKGLAINVQKLLENMDNPALVEEKVACVVDQGPCDKIGRTLKHFLPVIGTGGRCFRCTPQETTNLRKVVSKLQRRYPRCWHVVLASLDGRQGGRTRARGCA